MHRRFFRPFPPAAVLPLLREATNCIRVGCLFFNTSRSQRLFTFAGQKDSCSISEWSSNNWARFFLIHVQISKTLIMTDDPSCRFCHSFGCQGHCGAVLTLYFHSCMSVKWQKKIRSCIWAKGQQALRLLAHVQPIGRDFSYDTTR